MSECGSVEEFIEAFRGYCDSESIFVSTEAPKRVGASLSFRVTLANGDPVIVGSGDVVEAYPDERNDLGRAGMRIKFKQIDIRSRITVGKFDSSESPNGDDARIACKLEEDKGAHGKPVVPPQPRQATMKMIPRTWTPPVGKPPADSSVEERSTLPIRKPVFAEFDADDEENTNVTHASPATAGTPDTNPEARPPDPVEDESSGPADDESSEPAESAAGDEDAQTTIPIARRTASGAANRDVRAKMLPALPSADDKPAPSPKPPKLPPVADTNDWGDIDDWKSSAPIGGPANVEPAHVVDMAVPEIEVSGEFEISNVLPPRSPDGDPLSTDPNGVPDEVSATASGSIRIARALSSRGESDELEPLSSAPAPSPVQMPSLPPGSARPPTANGMVQPVLPATSSSIPGSTGAPAGPMASPGSAPVYPPMQHGGFSDTTSTEGFTTVKLSPIQAAAISGGVAVVIGLVLGYLIWGGDDEQVAASAGSAATAQAAKTAEGNTETETAPDERPAGDDSKADEGSTEGGGDELPTGSATDPNPATAIGTDDTTTQCSISVTSVPRRATAYLGDERLGRTPFTGAVPCGEHEIVVRKSHYVAGKEAAALDPGTPAEVSFKLSRKRYKIRVTSFPSGASTRVNGKSIGTTPTSTRVPSLASAKVYVFKAGYKSWSKIVKPKKNIGVNANLKPLSRRTPKKNKKKTRRKRR